MSSQKRALLRLSIVCLMLMLCATCWSAPSTTEEPLMLNPPPHLKNFIVLPSGDVALYFREDDWIEFSRYVFGRVEGLIDESVAEAVKPLLIDIAGLEAENKVLRRPRVGALLIGLGGLAIGIIAGALIAH